MRVVELVPETAASVALNSLDTNVRIVICRSKAEAEQFAADGCVSKRGLTDAGVFDVEAWFQRREAILKETWDEEAEFDEGNPYAEYVGSWDEAFVPVPDADDFSNRFDVPVDTKTGLAYGLEIPVTASWEVVMHTHFGGCRQSHDDVEHGAVWRRWEEHYGAHIVGMDSRGLSVYVRKPPPTVGAAMALAWEHLHYASDLMGVPGFSVARHAMSLHSSNHWTLIFM